MATISQSIALNDRMSSTLRAITTAMNSTLRAMASVAPKGEQLSAEFGQMSADIHLAELAMKNFDDQMNSFNSSTQSVGDGFTVLKGVASNAISAIGNQVIGVVSNLDDWVDQTTLLTARLNMINDGTQTTSRLQDSVFQAAQRSRVEYSLMADSVARLNLQAGDIFKSNREALHYAELLGKAFRVASTDTAAMTGATRQLVQALGSGVLRGDELNSVFEAAPNIIQNIADYLEVPIGQIRAMAAEGQITADIVKNSMFAAADDINSKFNEMPMTIGQIRQSLQNEIYMASQPFLQGLGDAARYLYDNIDAISPVVITLTANFAVLMAVMAVKKIYDVATSLTALQVKAIGVNTAISGVTIGLGAIFQAVTATDEAGKTAAITMGIISVAVGGLTIAMWALNASMYANPIFLIAGIAATVLGGAAIIIGLIREVTNETNAMTSSVVENRSEIDNWINSINNAAMPVDNLSNSINNIATAEHGAAVQAQALSRQFSSIASFNDLETKSLKQLSSMYNYMNGLIPNFTKNLGLQDESALKALSSLEGLSGIELDNAVAGLRAMNAESGALYGLSNAILDVTASYYEFARASAFVSAFQGILAEKATEIIRAEIAMTDISSQIETVHEKYIARLGKASPLEKQAISIELNELNKSTTTQESIVANANKQMDYAINSMLPYLEETASFGEMFKPVVKDGAVKTSQQGEIKINNEDLKILLDLSTQRIKMEYNQLTPQFSVHVENINENVDGEALLNEMAMKFEEFASSDLNEG